MGNLKVKATDETHKCSSKKDYGALPCLFLHVNTMVKPFFTTRQDGYFKVFHTKLSITKVHITKIFLVPGVLSVLHTANIYYQG